MLDDNIPPSHPDYWSSRYLSVNTPWDFDGVPADLREFLKRKDTGSNPQARGKVLIPGCGLGHEIRAFTQAGYDVTAILQLKVEGNALPDVTDRLEESDQMISVYEVTGDHDIIAPRHELFVGGKFVAPSSGKYFPSINPATEQQLTEIAAANEADVDAAETLEPPLDLVRGQPPLPVGMQPPHGGVGVNATTSDELRRAVNEAMDSGKPTLINAVIDPEAGTESGRIGNLNPQSALRKKCSPYPSTPN